jgi:N-sulfoglucosamine sulfohydrolase
MRLLICTVLFLLVVQLGAETPARRPNILFAFADDYGRYASAYAGHDARPTVNRLIRTPHIDSVAEAGVLFLNAHVDSPSCTPCRSALLSGRHFWQTGRGAILLGAVWDEEIPSFPLRLRDAGYHIGKTYKVWVPGTPADAPFGRARHAYESAGREFSAFSQNVGKALRNGASLEAAKERLYDEVRQNFRAFLADRSDDQPFCYWFGPTNTHRSWLRGSGKDHWNLDPAALEGHLPAFLPDVPEIREDFADYLGECMAFDAAIGVLLDELRQAGELEHTLVVVSGDHGAPGFPNGKCNLYDFGTGVTLAIAGPGIGGGRVVEDLLTLSDLAPTFLEAGGVPRAEGMTGKSLLPLLRSAGTAGAGEHREFIVTGRERHVDSARAGNLPYPQRAIRTRDHLYIVNFEPDRYPMGDLRPPGQGPDEPDPADVLKTTWAAFRDFDAGPTKAWLYARRDDPRWAAEVAWAFGKRPAEELYSVREDPDQIRNLAADPALAAVKADLRQRLFGVLEATADPRVSGDRLTFERPPFAGN